MSGKEVGRKDLCDSLEMSAERRGKPQQDVCYRDGGDTGRGVWRRDRRHEDLCLGYLFPWPECAVGPQGMSAGIGNGIKQ